MTKKGKQNLPYLLSTTKSLLKSKRYYYELYDFRFQCKRNRDCYTERNVRINMTRQWHNIILPNAILCRESGFKPKFQDALDALNHAMTNGKTERSLATWRQICQEEATLPKEQKVVYKYRRSFYYYVLGMAATKDGLLYSLPKKKVVSLTAYMVKVRKFIYQSLPPKNIWWMSPWDGLNELVYKWKHFDDEYTERVAARKKRISKLRSEANYIWDWEADADARRNKILAEIAVIEKEDDDDEAPEWPSTLRELCSTFHVSMTTAKQFKDWLRQYELYAKDAYDGEDFKLVSWAPPKSAKIKQDTKPEPDMVDVDGHVEDSDDGIDDTDVGIERDIQSVVNSGERPVGRVEDDEISALPF